MFWCVRLLLWGEAGYGGLSGSLQHGDVSEQGLVEELGCESGLGG